MSLLHCLCLVYALHFLADVVSTDLQEKVFPVSDPLSCNAAVDPALVGGIPYHYDHQMTGCQDTVPLKRSSSLSFVSLSCDVSVDPALVGGIPYHYDHCMTGW